MGVGMGGGEGEGEEGGGEERGKGGCAPLAVPNVHNASLSFKPIAAFGFSAGRDFRPGYRHCSFLICGVFLTSTRTRFFIVRP